MSLERFSRRMKRRANNVPHMANRVKRETALAVDQTVVMSTPVDTGTARSNWRVALGEPIGGIIEAYAPTSHGGAGETENARGALAQGKGEIEKSSPGESIHITNNVEYIVPLNQGHSAQAPAMFVESAVDAGVQAVRRSRIDTMSSDK